MPDMEERGKKGGKGRQTITIAKKVFVPRPP